MNRSSRTPTGNENWIWENYWQGDRVALCLDSDFQEYDERVSDAWKTWFSGFDEGADLLDICTGNGAVALLAHDMSQETGKAFNITGVDRAGIDPARFVNSGAERFEAIKFLGGVDIADIPYPDASFDGVSGQYALEYTDIFKSLQEISRVLRPRCQVRFLLHAGEGSIAAGARLELERIQAFQSETKIFVVAKRAIDTATKLRKMPQPGVTAIRKAEQAETRFRSVLKACEGTYQQNEKDFIFGTVTRLVNTLQAIPHYEEREIQEQFRKVKTSLEAHHGRLNALACAAVQYSDCQSICKALGTLGFEPGPITASSVDGQQIGWVIDAARS